MYQARPYPHQLLEAAILRARNLNGNQGVAIHLVFPTQHHAKEQRRQVNEECSQSKGRHQQGMIVAFNFFFLR